MPSHTFAQTRKMKLSDFQAAYPGDLQAGALEEIRERHAAMAAAAAAAVPVPATGRAGRTAAKRGAEPETVLRTVRARRGPVAPPPKFSDAPVPAAAAADTAARRSTRSRLGSTAAEEEQQQQKEQQQQPGKWQGHWCEAASPAVAWWSCQAWWLHAQRWWKHLPDHQRIARPR